MTRSIKSFTGNRGFLSNFHALSPEMEWRGTRAPTLEHLFQAHKTVDSDEREWVLGAESSTQAKRRGQKITMRPEWDQIKLAVMAELLSVKFADPALRDLLNSTGDATLIEGNTHHDTFWGRCDCDRHEFRGTNWLGRLLTIERSRRRLDIAPPF